jgi:hypothetical protein
MGADPSSRKVMIYIRFESVDAIKSYLADPNNPKVVANIVPHLDPSAGPVFAHYMDCPPDN